MSKYEKLKVDELKQLLTDRKLPTTGRKSDLVARLVEADEKTATPTAATTTTQSQSQTPAAAKAETKTKEPAPVEKKPETKPTPAEETEKKKETADDDDREAKLAARAARFGIPKDEEAERKRARQARFGTTDASAAPEEGPLSHSRVKPEGKKANEKKAKVDDKKAQEKRKVASVLDDPVEAEKARKRALKFGTGPVDVPVAKATATAAK